MPFCYYCNARLWWEEDGRPEPVEANAEVSTVHVYEDSISTMQTVICKRGHQYLETVLRSQNGNLMRITISPPTAGPDDFDLAYRAKPLPKAKR